MSLGAVRSQGSSGEDIVHITGIRFRVVGSGSLRLRLISMDSIETQTLVALTMTATTNIQPFRLANFNQQRAQLEITTTAINETFRINRIIVFAKPVFTMHPA